MVELGVVVYDVDVDINVEVATVHFNRCQLMVVVRNWVRLDDAVH